MNTPPLIGRIARLITWVVAGTVVLAAFGAIYQTLATKSAQQKYPAPGQLVDVGGYRLHIYCMGENKDGSPTAILEQGSGGISAGGCQDHTSMCLRSRRHGLERPQPRAT